MKKVYVAGPLRAKEFSQTIKNISKLMEIGEEVRLNGFATFVPALDLLMGIKFGDYEMGDYMDNGLAWLSASDALLLTGDWDLSAGCLAELDLAEELDIPVFFTIESMKEYFAEQSKDVNNCKGCRDCKCEEEVDRPKITEPLDCPQVQVPALPYSISVKTKGVLGLDEGDVLTYNFDADTYDYSTKIVDANGYSEEKTARISSNLYKKNTQHFKAN